MFGRLEELHEVTKNRKRLDEAFVKVSTDLASIDRIMNYNIDGAAFKFESRKSNAWTSSII